MLFNTTIQAFYPYREAFVDNVSLEVSLTEKDEVMLKTMIQENGYKFDNHVTFLVGDIAVSYSDGKLYIGTKIKKEYW